MECLSFFSRKQLTAFFITSFAIMSMALRAETPKPTLVVLDLLSKGADSTEVSVITEELRLQILKLGRFQLIERERVKDILKEHEFSLTESASDEWYVELGKMLSVQKMIAGQVGKVGSIYSIYARIIDVETGTVSSMDRVTARSIDEVYSTGVPELVSRLFSVSRESLTEDETAVEMQPRAKSVEPVEPVESEETTGPVVGKREERSGQSPPPSSQPARDIGIEMVWIKAGRLTMGSSSSEKGRDKDEGPQHSVTLSGFFLSQSEVTQGQYRAFDPDRRSHFEGSNRPVESVTWFDAARFCNWLSKQEGLVPFYDENDLLQRSPQVTMNWEADGYRLPTEAEWEYACRAGRPSPFSTGQCLATEQANYDGEHPYRMCSGGENRQRTWDVGSGTANAFELCDMHGNVMEWCNDWYGKYRREAVSDPTGSETGTERVARGGSWQSCGEACRSAERESFPPDQAADYLGFRVAKPE